MECPPSTASAASLSPTYRQSSSSSAASSASGTKEHFPKKIENEKIEKISKISVLKKKEENHAIIPVQNSKKMQIFKGRSYLPDLGLDTPGSRLSSSSSSSCSLRDTASSSSSSIQSVCSKGKGTPNLEMDIGTLFAKNVTLNCRNNLHLQKLPACSKTTGAEARKPADQSQGGIPK